MCARMPNVGRGFVWILARFCLGFLSQDALCFLEAAHVAGVFRNPVQPAAMLAILAAPLKPAAAARRGSIPETFRPALTSMAWRVRAA